MLSIEENSALISLMADLVKNKAGLKLIQPSDCRGLSADILRATGGQISETTLKRFFGFAAATSRVSVYSKNVLCCYLGLSGWKEFLATYGPDRKKSVSLDADSWQKVQTRAARFSNYTYKALKNRSGIPFNATIDRRFAETQIQYFLDSDYPITSFIGPGGCGKSILLSRLVDKFWLGSEALFPQDIVWFVSGQTLGGLLGQGFDFDAWINQQAGMTEELKMRNYFSENPEAVGGRMILVLDGFDEIMQKDELLFAFFERLCDFISLNQQNKWFKIIFSVRTSTWSGLCSDLRRSGFISRFWYLGAGTRVAEMSNVEALRPAEVTDILGRLYAGRSGGSQPVLKRELLDQLSNPFYIQLLYQLERLQAPKKLNLDAFSYFDLLSEFINRKIYQTRYSSEKISIIKRFLENVLGASNKEFIVKDELLLPGSDFSTAYYELLAFGVLVEDVFSQRQHLKKIVYFNHINLLEYFLCMELLTTNRGVVDTSLFLLIQEKFRNSRYQLQIYKWLIYVAVNTEQLKIFSIIPALSISQTEKKELIVFFAEMLEKKFLTESDHPVGFNTPGNAEFYFPNLISDEYTGRRYENALRIFLQLTVAVREKTRLHVALALRSYWNLDSAGMFFHIGQIRTLAAGAKPGAGPDPLIFLQGIYDLCTTGKTALLDNNILLAEIERSGLADLNLNESDTRMMYGVLLCSLQVINNPETSGMIIRQLAAGKVNMLLGMRSNPMLMAWFLHFVHINICGRNIRVLRFIRLIHLFLEQYGSIHLSGYTKIAYEMLLAEQSLMSNEPELAVIYQRRIQSLAELKEYNYLHLIAERNILAYYRRNDMHHESERLLYLLRSKVYPGDFKLEFILGTGLSGLAQYPEPG